MEPQRFSLIPKSIIRKLDFMLLDSKKMALQGGEKPKSAALFDFIYLLLQFLCSPTVRAGAECVANVTSQFGVIVCVQCHPVWN